MKRFIIISMFLVATASGWAQFAGGNGTAANPYQITTATHLNNVRYYLSSHFILNNDINMKGTAYAANWIPIGDM